MQINKDDIAFAAEYALKSLLSYERQNEIQTAEKQNVLSEEKAAQIVKKFSVENAFCNQDADFLISQIISHAILEYHEQLRIKLLESGIDIGEMDINTENMRKTYREEMSNDNM